MENKIKALFLDRDGVINKDNGYVYKIDDFIFIDGIFDVLSVFKRFGFIFFIITNQSGIARKYYTKSDFTKLTNWMLKQFKKRDIKIEKVLYCPHLPDDNCKCRKPKSGMIDEILDKYNIDLKNSFLIGDKNSDILCAKNANIPNTILITKEKQKQKYAKYEIEDITKSIQIIRSKYES